jgi:radical SAM protein with 4Fe4S-binding SPASM domain
MTLFDEVKDQLLNSKIGTGQLDPNGFCNAGCWFCPIRYEGNPKEFSRVMPLSLMERIFQQIRASKFIDHLDFLYTSHYNEVLLYPHFKEMLALFKQYGIRTMVLSNGTTLSKSRVDAICEYSDIVPGVCLNIPASNPTDWSRYSGFAPEAFEAVLTNIEYAMANLPSNVPLSIQVNGLSGVYHEKQSLANSMVIGKSEDVHHQVAGWKEIFPSLNAYPLFGLSDRASLLSKLNVITENIQPLEADEEVYGCKHNVGTSNRAFGMLHINAKGDLFLCCSDFGMEHRFGNLGESTLDELWASDAHVNMILNAFNTICAGCSSRAVRKR